MTAQAVPLPTALAPRLSRARDAVAFHVETITDESVLESRRDEWTALLCESESDGVFLSFEWLYTWWKHLRGRAQLNLIEVRRGGELVALAPFVRVPGHAWSAPRLTFMGTGRVGSDYLDIVARRGEEDAAIAHLASHLRQSGEVVDLPQLRVTSSSGTRLARALCTRGASALVKRTHRCPYIDLREATFESYLAGLSSQQRYAFNRKLRALEAAHEVKFERAATEARRAELLPVLFELHARRWSERGGSDGLEGQGVLEFHEEFSRLAQGRGWLRLFVLWIDGKAAAALYGFRYGRVFSFYQSGFDPSFSRDSVGLVTMGLAIRSAISEGASEFDFLHGVESYKFHWTKSARRLGRVVIFPRTVRGRLSFAAGRAKDAARRLARRVPRSWVVRAVFLIEGIRRAAAIY